MCQQRTRNTSVSGLRTLMVPAASAELPDDLGPPPWHHFSRTGPALTLKKEEIRESG